jgi:starch synthase
LPLYLKKAYKDDPIFSHSKVVLSLHDDLPKEQFSPAFADKIFFGAVSEKDIDLLKAAPDGINLAKTAARFSDGVVVASENIPASLISYCKDRGLKVAKIKAKSFADGTYIDEYNAFYDQL